MITIKVILIINYFVFNIELRIVVKSYVQVKGFIGNKSALIVKAINLNICIYIFELTINQKAVQSPKQILFMLNVQS